jgi:hypothetical protein
MVRVGRRPIRILVATWGIAVVGAGAVVLTFLPWYWQGRGQHHASVSGWSHLWDAGVSFDAPVHGTYVRAPTGVITIVSGLALLGVAYAAWWLNEPDAWRRPPNQNVVVRCGAALVGLLAGLGLVLPLAIAANVRHGNAVITEVPRTLFSAGLITMSLLLAFAFVPKREY